MRRAARRQAVRRTAATATIAVLTLGGLTACNDDSPSSATDPDAASTSAAASESPSEPAAGETVDPATFLDDVLGDMSDLTTAHATMKVEGGPAAMSMEGDVDYAASPPEMAMTMTNAMLGKGDIEMRMVDGDLYMQVPGLSSGTWVKMPLTGKGSPLGDDFLDQMDPSRALEAMKDAVDEVTYVGDEDVDGETLQHYSMKVRGEAFERLQGELGGTGAADLPSVITYDLWIDADNRVRQMEVAMGDLGSMTMTLSDWGEPVEIEAPPASDVAEMPGGMPMMG